MRRILFVLFVLSCALAASTLAVARRDSADAAPGDSIAASIDCDLDTPAVQSACSEFVDGVSTTVAVVLTNVSSSSISFASFDLNLISPDTTRLASPEILGGQYDSNPDFADSSFPGVWQCGNYPDNDTGAGGAGTTTSKIGCYTVSGFKVLIPGQSVALAFVTLDIPAGALPGAVTLTLTGVVVGNPIGEEYGTCPTNIRHMECEAATVTLVNVPPGSTATATRTATPTPANTATATPTSSGAGATATATPTATYYFAIDCNLGIAGVQTACTYPLNAPGIDVGVLLVNNGTSSPLLNAFDFKLVNASSARLSPSVGIDGDLESNPDFNNALLATTPGWLCALPPPDNDTGELGASQTVSRIGCFVSTPPFGSPFAAGSSALLGTVHYAVAPGATVGVANFSLAGADSGDEDGYPLARCYLGGIDSTFGCTTTTITLVAPPPTATPTNSPTRTATATPCPCAWGLVNKIPEGNLNNVDLAIPAANLWLCVTGPCSGPGEGNLIVFEYGTNVLTGDQNGDSVQDGLGAYEFDVEYDNFVIQSVNPSDVVFNPGPLAPYPGGADGVLDGEGAARAPASCGFSLVFENVVHFGCVTAGQAPGPVGNFDLGRLNLIPHSDLTNDIFPGNDNGVVTVLKDNGCELVDTFGHPTTGSVGGGLTPVCGDLAVTVRILEGDLNLDCEVDVQDQQMIAWRYGSFFGSGLYSQWYDLEPNLHDLDIDIKDIQKVFGRDGSTCQTPIQPQPPLPPPAPFGN